MNPIKLGPVRRVRLLLNQRLIKISILACLVAVLTVIHGKNVYASPQEALNSEVDALNRAVKIYLDWGGNLDGVSDPQQVIAKLQTVAESNDIPKFRGILVDARMAPVMQSLEEARGEAPRALWSVTSKHFHVASSGRPGIKFFVFE